MPLPKKKCHLNDVGGTYPLGVGLPIVALTLVAVCVAVGSARTWTDATGRHRIEAELVAVEASVVQLRKPDGVVISVPLARLSAADRAFVASARQVRPDVPAPGTAANSAAPRYGDPVEHRMKFTAEITGTRGLCTRVIGSFPAPAPWNEQQVEIVSTQKSPLVRAVSYRDHPGGSRQLVVTVPRLAAGQTAEVEVTYLLRRRPILAPERPALLVAASRPSRDLTMYKKSSPGIRIEHPRIRKTAAELADGDPGAWELVHKTYDWVRTNMRYVGGELRGAVWAAQHGEGDCEEYTSLFVALCRANGIPARAVWVPGHCFAEFHLVDPQGTGHWFPCDTLHPDAFGKSTSVAMILQKGDTFRVPEKPQPQRYLADTLTGNIGRGGEQPTFRSQYQAAGHP